MTEARRAAIVPRMDFLWLILYALGAAVALYGAVVVGLWVTAAIMDRREVGSMRFVSGETIILPPEPEQPRKRWRLTIERS